MLIISSYGILDKIPATACVDYCICECAAEENKISRLAKRFFLNDFFETPKHSYFGL